MENIPSPESFIFSDDYICQWDSCLKNFDDAELLYEHLRDDHVGRKAHHNLCLTCRWDKCNVPAFAKRDHITSHLRVHVASKPYRCEICNKGFKRPQDLKKHEKIHQDNPANGASSSSNASNKANPARSSRLQPVAHGHDQYHPLTPPSYTDRSPSIPASTISSIHSPYSIPMSPASLVDPAESWNNPGLSSPSYSTNSDLYSSPRSTDMDLGNQGFSRPNIDVSGTYYGAFPSAASGYDDMVSPMSAKRPRDGLDDIFSDTLGLFAMEAKKKRMDQSYTEDVVGHLNALAVITDVSPLTTDRLLTALPDLRDWNQLNQFSQYCSALYEDVSGEIFESQPFDTLFPDLDQKQNPATLNTDYTGVNGFQVYGTAPVNPGFVTSTSSQNDSIYKEILPEDPFVSTTLTAPSMTFGTDKLPWEVTDTPVRLPGVVTSLPVKNVVQQQINPFNHQYVSMNNLMNSRPSPEIKKEIKEEFIEPKIGAKVERTYADMSTQTKAKQEKYASEGGMMMMQRPATEKKKSKPAYKDMDPELLMMSAPAVPTSPMPTLDVEEASAEGLEEDREQTADEESAQEQSEVNSTVQQAPSTRFGSYVQRARAKQAAAAAAAAAAVTSVSTEPLDPLEAMTRQLAEIHLDKSSSKLATAKSVADSDEERMKKAAKAREMCAQNPERKQHADVLFTLLKSVHEMNRILAEYSSTQARHAQAGGAVPRHTTAGSVYPRSSGVYAQNQGQIRTVSSYLNRRSPYQPSSLQQEHRPTDPDYSQLRSSLAGDSGSEISTVTPTADETLVASDSPVLYPTTDLHRTEEVPFELSEEERRIIEEDNARIAAAKAAAEATGTQYTPV